MSAKFVITAKTGLNLFATLQQITAAGSLGNQWDQTNTQWATPEVAINDRKVALTEGTGANAGRYTAGIGSALGTYTGSAVVSYHDDDNADKIEAQVEVYFASGVEKRDSTIGDLESIPNDVYVEIETTQGGLTSTNMRGTDDALLAASYTAADNAGITSAVAQATTAATQATTAATQATNAAADASTLETRLTADRAGRLDNLDTVLSTVNTNAADALTQATFAAADANTASTQATNAATDTDTLLTRLTAIRAGNLDNLDEAISVGSASASAAQTAAESVDAKLTAGRAGYLDNLAIGENVAGAAAVAAIQNTTRSKFICPDEIQLPASGTRAVRLHIMLFDTDGNMEAPDVTPTVTAANESGTDRSGNLGTVTSVSTGHYRVDYTVADSHAEEQVIFIASITESGQVLKDVTSMFVVAISSGGGFNGTDRTNLSSIVDKLPSRAYLTGTDAADGDINAVNVDNPSTFMADVSGLATAASIATLPNDVYVEIETTQGGLTSTNMRGTDNALLAASYTAPDNTSIGDALTQATTAATQATTAATQATNAASDAATIEARLTAARATNLDNLDAAITSRSDFDESTDNVTLAAGHLLATEAKQDTIIAQTDLIPASPAAVGDIPTAAQIASEVDTTITASHGSGLYDVLGDATLANQVSILAAIAGITPDPPSVSVVSPLRTWHILAEAESGRSGNIVSLIAGTTATLAMNFSDFLNPGTGISSVTSVTDLSGNALVPTDLLPSQDRQAAHFEVTGLTAGLAYELKVTVATSDGDTLVGIGWLYGK